VSILAHRVRFRVPLRRAAGLIGLAFAAGTASADTFVDDHGLFADVRIVGFDNSRLVIRFADGRRIERNATEVHSIALDNDADMAADELTRAERLLQLRRFDQAMLLYDRARSAAAAEWVRQFSDFRTLQCLDALKRPADAIRVYLSLVDRHPALIEAAVPRNLPRDDTDEGRALAAALDEALRTHRTDSRYRAAARLRDIMKGLKPADPKKKPAAPVAGAAKPPAGGVAVPPRERATARVYRLLEEGQIAAATAEMRRGRDRAAPANQDIWLLAEAECLLAGGDPTRAGLTAMKVLVVDADSSYAAEALYVAGRAHEPGRVARARNFYQESMRHPTATAALRDLIEKRLAALDRAGAAAGSGATPAGGDASGARSPRSGAEGDDASAPASYPTQQAGPP